MKRLKPVLNVFLQPFRAHRGLRASFPPALSATLVQQRKACYFADRTLGFLIIKKIRQITKARMPLIFLGKHDAITVDWPFYAEVWIVPKNTGIMTGAIVGGYFVENHRFI